MANYETLKSIIQDNIKQNGIGAITGPILQSALLSIVNSLGAGYQYKGVAAPDTNPGTPDEKCFYIASEAGTYTNFGGIVLKENDASVLKYDSSWHKESIGLVSTDMFGVQKTKFSVTNGQSHSSTQDKMFVKIKAGDRFTIKFAPDNTYGKIIDQIWAFNADGTETSYGAIAPNSGKTFTATKDIASLGAYVVATASGTVSLYTLYSYAEAQYESTNLLDPVAIDASNGVLKTISVDNVNKIVTVKKEGFRFIARGSWFYIEGSADMDLPYDSANYPNGGWFLKKSAMDAAAKGGTVQLNSNNIIFATVGSAEYTSGNVLLFATYYGYIPPVGLFGPYIVESGEINASDLLTYAFNSAYNTTDITAKCKQYSAMLNDSGVAETFIFMTDPHLLGSANTFNETNFKNYIGLMQKYYNMLPVDWMVCGGDWLNSGDYQAVACWKLGYADATMRKMFKRYYPMLGNHDTNYQGVVSADDPSRGDLTHQTIVNIMFRENKNTYYEWMGNTTRFFVFDTQLDWSASMDAFKWTQIDWMAQKLLTNTDAHIVVLQHIYYIDERNVAPMSQNIQSLCGAFNSRQSITLNGITYDFSAANGKIHCIIAGHAHEDIIVTDSSVPVWITTNMTDGGTPTFDLMLIDYTAGKLKSVRVGTGIDRTMDLA